VPFSWLANATPWERDLINRIAAQLDAKLEAVPAPTEPAPGPAEAAGVAAGAVLERVPLPWTIKRKVMEALLRDVHYYLFNVTSEPRPGTRYQVQAEIRKRFVDDLKKTTPAVGPHLVVSHSMGTVITYDCLKRVPDCPPVDALVTLGSPLGIDEVRDLLQPGWTPNTPPTAGWSPVDAFPADKVKQGAWANVYERFDPVDATAPKLARYYMRGGQPVVEDISVTNPGWWRHDLVKYFGQAAVRQRLRGLLDI
jgi:hypothetical protein